MKPRMQCCGYCIWSGEDSTTEDLCIIYKRTCKSISCDSPDCPTKKCPNFRNSRDEEKEMKIKDLKTGMAVKVNGQWYLVQLNTPHGDILCHVSSNLYKCLSLYFDDMTHTKHPQNNIVEVRINNTWFSVDMLGKDIDKYQVIYKRPSEEVAKTKAVIEDLKKQLKEAEDKLSKIQ